MTAETNAIRAYLRGDLAVGGSNATDNDRPNAIMAEGLDSWQAFVDVDEETIKDLCREIRRDPNNNVHSCHCSEKNPNCCLCSQIL